MHVLLHSFFWAVRKWQTFQGLFEIVHHRTFYETRRWKTGSLRPGYSAFNPTMALHGGIYHWTDALSPPSEIFSAFLFVYIDDKSFVNETGIRGRALSQLCFLKSIRTQDRYLPMRFGFSFTRGQWLTSRYWQRSASKYDARSKIHWNGNILSSCYTSRSKKWNCKTKKYRFETLVYAEQRRKRSAWSESSEVSILYPVRLHPIVFHGEGKNGWCLQLSSSTSSSLRSLLLNTSTPSVELKKTSILYYCFCRYTLPIDFKIIRGGCRLLWTGMCWMRSTKLSLTNCLTYAKFRKDSEHQNTQRCARSWDNSVVSRTKWKRFVSVS